MLENVLNYLKIQLVSRKHTYTYAQQEEGGGKEKGREREAKQAKGERHTEGGLGAKKNKKYFRILKKFCCSY